MFCVILALLAPGAAFGKAKRPLDWENVMKLRDGSTITVTLFNNEKHFGTVEGLVKPDILPLKTKAGSLSIRRGNIKTIITIKPKLANPGLYMMVGGVLLASAGGLAGTAKEISDLNNGSLNGSAEKNGETLEVAGIAVAVGGLAVFFLAGKPRTIYEAKQAPTDAVQ